MQGNIESAGTAQGSTNIAQVVGKSAARRAEHRALVAATIARRLGTPCPHGREFGDPDVALEAEGPAWCPDCSRADARLLGAVDLAPLLVTKRDAARLYRADLDLATRGRVDALVDEWLALFGERVVDPFRLVASLRQVRVCVTDPDMDSCGCLGVLVLDASTHEPKITIFVSHRDDRIRQRERALFGAAYVVAEAQGLTCLADARGLRDSDHQAAVTRCLETVALFARSLLAPTRDLQAAVAAGDDLHQRFPWASRGTLRARLRDLRTIESARSREAA